MASFMFFFFYAFPGLPTRIKSFDRSNKLKATSLRLKGKKYNMRLNFLRWGLRENVPRRDQSPCLRIMNKGEGF